MSGDGHSLAISGYNQGLQDFNSVLQSKLVRYFPVFEHNREYKSVFAFSFFLCEAAKQERLILKYVFHHDSFGNC